MNDMSLPSKIYIKINNNSIHVPLWELSVTIRFLKQFSSVKLEVGIWSLVTFCKQKCVVSSSLSKYLTYQTFFCESMKLSPFLPVDRESNCYRGTDVFWSNISGITFFNEKNVCLLTLSYIVHTMFGVLVIMGKKVGEVSEAPTWHLNHSASKGNCSKNMFKQ